jgi:hypothetical protein
MKLRSSLILTTLLLAALPLAAQTLDWTMVGSAGVPDNGNSLYAATGPALGIQSNAIATMQFRYPVTNTYGSATSKTPGWTTFSATYIDNHSTGSVVATLMEVDACTATERQVCQITSNDGDTSPQCDTCSISGINFASHTYYIDVVIAKTDTPANPKLVELALY